MFVALCYFSLSEEDLGNGENRKLSEKAITEKGNVATSRE
jgi:hypothetical protein